MPKRICVKMVEFSFPRKSEDGSIVLKRGLVREDAILAVEPGTNDAYTHLHLSNGAELIVGEPVGAFKPAEK